MGSALPSDRPNRNPELSGVTIRPETARDHDDIATVVSLAFGSPSGASREAQLVALPPAFALVEEVPGSGPAYSD